MSIALNETTVPSELYFRTDQSIDLTATAAEDESQAMHRFQMTAYTGGELRVEGFPLPVVVDLAGLHIPQKSRPVLRDHDLSRIVGHTEAIKKDASAVQLVGVVSGVNEHSREVVESAANGFPWQASIGISIDRIVRVNEGIRVQVNGHTFTGPILVARRSTLREISFVAIGADDNTSARIAAAAAETRIEVVEMEEFEQWVVDSGFEPDELSEEQTQVLRAAFDAEQNVSDGGDASDGAGGEGTDLQAAGTATAVAVAEEELPNPVAQMRLEAAAEATRIHEIRQICAGEHLDLEAQAITDGWTREKAELEVLRASRPTAPAIGSSTPSLNMQTLEAAACLSAGVGETVLVADYGERTMEAAYAMRNIGLKELVAECARMEGMDVPRVFGDGAVTIRAGFSTISLPGILESVMNRTMLAAYETAPIAAFDLCAIGSVSDFKEITRYRLLGTGGFEKVAPDGELKHGKMSEKPFGNKADTYGQILMLTRKDIINDDLNAFMDIPRQMGRSGAESIDDLFFTLFLSNPGTFFGPGNNNFLAGLDTAFGSDALSKARTLFRKQKAGPGKKAKDQKPINVRPERLVVPIEIETDAELLMGASQILLDGATAETKYPTDNPHRNKYRVVSAPHLSDTYYAGASGKAWYLFADPNVLPAFELVFLNGRRTPVIERVEAPPNTLGMGFRSYLDVGCREQDPRGAVKLKGEV